MELLNLTRYIWMPAALFVIVYFGVKWLWELAKHLGDYLED